MNGSRIVGYDSEQSNPINGSKQVMAFTFRVKSGASAGSSLSAAVSGVSVSYIRSSDGNAVTPLTPGSARWSASVSAPLSANANLAALSCANAELSPTFSAGTTQYSVTVPYDVTSLRLSASAEDGGAKVSTSGNDLSVGANTVTITVTAPSGAVKRYTISVIRQPDPNYTASTDAALSALTASYGEISPAFTSDVTDYVLYVPHETEHITLSGTARDGKAVQVTGADAALDEGENVLTVTCTAEDGVTVMTYTVHVWRMPAYRRDAAADHRPDGHRRTRPARAGGCLGALRAVGEPVRTVCAAVWRLDGAALCRGRGGDGAASAAPVPAGAPDRAQARPPQGPAPAGADARCHRRHPARGRAVCVRRDAP